MHVQHSINIKEQFVGFHRWKNAPDHLAYLRYPHRHVFHVTVHVLVHHTDRDIEFHEFKAYVKGVIAQVENAMSCFDEDKCSSMSCEDIGAAIARLCSRYLLSKVEVSEDGECGAITEISC